MLNALEGKRALPRFRPPHMASAGLWAKPTIVNNVETLLLRAAHRAGRRARAWMSLARTDEGGTKIYTVAGKVKRPGWWELPMGTPMREIIEEHAGGMRDGFKLRAVIPGGASTLVRPGEGRRRAAGLRPTCRRWAAGWARPRWSSSTTRPARSACCATWRCSSPASPAAGARPAGAACPGSSRLLDDIEEGRGRQGDLEMLESLGWYDRRGPLLLRPRAGRRRSRWSAASSTSATTSRRTSARGGAPTDERGHHHHRRRPPRRSRRARTCWRSASRSAMDLPYFCWHPAMGSVGACRQCAVQASSRTRTTRTGEIVMACMTPVTGRPALLDRRSGGECASAPASSS